MLNITFQGGPFLFVGDSLDESAPITTAEDYRAGRVSVAHYWPRGESGIVKRYNNVIGTREDIVVLGPATIEPMTWGDVMRAFDNMLGGDPRWFSRLER